MRPTLLLLGACVPIAACSTDLATAPNRVATEVVGLISDINTSDIERVEIIKAASATAIYGSAESCPPIVITTRRTPNASLPRPTIRKGKPGSSIVPK